MQSAVSTLSSTRGTIHNVKNHGEARKTPTHTMASTDKLVSLDLQARVNQLQDLQEHLSQLSHEIDSYEVCCCLLLFLVVSYCFLLFLIVSCCFLFFLVVSYPLLGFSCYFLELVENPHEIHSNPRPKVGWKASLKRKFLKKWKVFA